MRLINSTNSLLLIGLLTLSFFGCNKSEITDEFPNINGDLLITGQVTHELTEAPIEGIEIQARINFQFNSTAVSDEEGNYEILFQNIASLYGTAGFNQGEIDTILSYPISLNVAPASQDCEWVRIDPAETYQLFVDYQDAPIQETANFSLLEGGEVRYTFLDTAGVDRPNPFSARIELRGLSYQDPYDSWLPFELDIFDGLWTERCLPYDVPVEATVTIQEYMLPQVEILQTFIHKDTITLTSGNNLEIEIEY